MSARERIIIGFTGLCAVAVWIAVVACAMVLLDHPASAQAGGCANGFSLYAHRNAGSSTSLPLDCTMSRCRQVRAHTSGSANLGCLPIVGCIGQVNWSYQVTGLNKAGSPNCPSAVDSGTWTL